MAAKSIRKPYDNYQKPANLQNIDVENLLPDDEDPASKQYLNPKNAPPSIQGLPEGYGSLQWFQKQEITPPTAQANVLSDVGAPDPGEVFEEEPLDENIMRSSFVGFAANHFCYAKDCALLCELKNITPTRAVHYCLETYAERRFVTLVVAPYDGKGLKHPSEGQIPDPWDVDVSPDQLFKDCRKVIPVPFTEQQMQCYRCEGMGYLLCSACGGSASVECSNCKGTMFDPNAGDYTTCIICAGTGQQHCLGCSNGGIKQCSVCDGQGNLKSFIQMEVLYDDNKDDYIVELTNLPDEMIKLAAGEILLLQTFQKLKPLQNYNNPDVLENAKKFYTKHLDYYANARPILQRHTLESVLVTEAEYTWNGVTSKFWVYGKQRNVYCPDYPEKTCCSIM